MTGQVCPEPNTLRNKCFFFFFKGSGPPRFLPSSPTRRFPDLFFVLPADGSAAPRDLPSGADFDVPPDERGGPGDINFSPDSKEICFTAVTDKMEAISTNGDLFTVPVAGGDIKSITTEQGFDGEPVYSPDGKYIAYHSQLKPEYESDRDRKSVV